MRDNVQTPAQTIGPFFGYALPYEGGEDLVDRSHPDAIRLHGTVFDGDGTGVPDALVEIWQADGDGVVSRETGSIHRDGYTFTGFGRSATDANGHYQFTTVVPGSANGAAPFFAVIVFARGMMHKVHTRIYLPGADLAALPAGLDPARAQTLVATRDADGALHHDIRLQGEGETVFLAYE